MGYTHYWKFKRQVSDAEFDLFIEDVRKIDQRFVLAQGAETMVVFNVWETFIFRRTDTDFNFCKTGRADGDKFVTAVLAVAKHHFGDDLQVSSDGNWADWAEGLLIAKERCGVEHLSSFLSKILDDEDLLDMARKFGVAK